MKKRFWAIYDVLLAFLVSVILVSTGIWILCESDGPLGDRSWYWIFAYACCVAVPPTLIIFGIHKFTIDLSCDKVELFYLVNYNTNSKDLNSNWNIFPSEIKKVTVVKLGKEEKRQYTSAKFLFSKYLKIEMKYGHTKYVYVSHYSNYQINKIIKLLTSGHCISTKDGSVSC